MPSLNEPDLAHLFSGMPEDMLRGRLKDAQAWLEAGATGTLTREEIEMTARLLWEELERRPDLFQRGGCVRAHQGGDTYAYSFALSHGWKLLLAADDGGFPVEGEPVAVCLEAPDHMTDYTRVCPNGAEALAFATEVAAKGAPYEASFRA